MFRQFGRFAPLALCLFAIVIVMGSCGGDDDTEGTEATETVGTETSSSSLPLARKIMGSYTTGLGQLNWQGYLTLSFDNTYQLRWIGHSEETGTLTLVDSTTLILDGVRHSYTYTDKMGGSTTRSPVALVITIDSMKTPDGQKKVKWFREGIENL